MIAVSETEQIKLKVSDFCPIAEADVELRPMSVFVGPSNTGKSYLAILIYALHQFFGAFSRENRKPFGLGLPGLPFFSSVTEMVLSDAEIDLLNAWVESERWRIESASRPGTVPPNSDLSAAVSHIVRRALVEAGSLNEVLKEEILRCLGLDVSANVVRHSSKDTKVGLMRAIVSTDFSENDAYKYDIRVDDKEVRISPTLPSLLPFNVSDGPPLPWFSLSPDDDGFQRATNARLHLASFMSAALAGSVGFLGRPAHYLPANRAGVMDAHQVAIRALIAGASRIAIRSTLPVPVLSGVLGDFLEQLIAFGSATTFSEFQSGVRLANLLETSLMQGSIRVERSEIDYPSFFYRPKNWQNDLPLMNSSSMVSELAPVVLYLRHVVQPGDTLIIEEPESHLHPSAQVEFTRLLAGAVRAGIRIVITTHSEWVLWELANLVRMSELPYELRNGLDGAEHAVEPTEVGAWLFESDTEKGGSVVREIPLDTESGTFPAGYGLITESLYKRWSTINRRIGKI